MKKDNERICIFKKKNRITISKDKNNRDSSN